jgi:hypothetical protein
MTDMDNGIREINIEKDEQGKYQKLQVVFGPHYFVELETDAAGKVTAYIGATHHGFKADASEVGGELEKIVYEIRDAHPELKVN